MTRGETTDTWRNVFYGEISSSLGFLYDMKGGKRKELVTTIDFDFSQVIFGPYVFAKATSTTYILLMLSSIH